MCVACVARVVCVVRPVCVVCVVCELRWLRLTSLGGMSMETKSERASLAMTSQSPVKKRIVRERDCSTTSPGLKTFSDSAPPGFFRLIWPWGARSVSIQQHNETK